MYVAASVLCRIEIRCEEAMKVIGQFSDCWRIGQIVSDTEHKGRKIWLKGKILW